MAGSGTKLWATGDTVTATDFQTYVQDQVVGVYADTSARDAAYGGSGEPTLAEGAVAFIKDVNQIHAYSSAWVPLLDLDTWASDASGNYTIKGDLTVGVDDTGHDVKFFGATSGSYALWDQSEDELRLIDSMLVVGNTTDAIDMGLVGGVATIRGINVGTSAYNDLVIRAGAGNQLYLDTDGNVGVGGDPSHEFQVTGATPTYQITSTSAVGATGGTETIADIDFEGQKNALYRTVNRIRARANGTWSTGTADDADSAFEFYANNGSGMQNAMTLDGYGGVFLSGSAVYNFKGSSDGNAFINAADTKAAYHRINNASEMVVNGSGVSIGRGDSGPSYRLDIHEETNDAVPLRVEMSSGGTANQYLARFTRNTGLLTNGIYCDTTTAYFGTPSDERVKRDIATIDPADSLAAITALRPVDFRYIADPDDGEIRNGLIAQEVEPLIPAAVHTVMETEPRMETVSVPRVEIVVDDDGNETTVPVLGEDGNQIIDEDTQPVLGDDGKRIIDTTGDSKMLSWDAVNAHMVGAIKELTARIAALEAA